MTLAWPHLVLAYMSAIVADPAAAAVLLAAFPELGAYGRPTGV